MLLLSAVRHTLRLISVVTSHQTSNITPEHTGTHRTSYLMKPCVHNTLLLAQQRRRPASAASCLDCKKTGRELKSYILIKTRRYGNGLFCRLWRHPCTQPGHSGNSYELWKERQSHRPFDSSFGFVCWLATSALYPEVWSSRAVSCDAGVESMDIHS